MDDAVIELSYYSQAMAENLNMLNNLIRSAIFRVDSSLQHKFYDTKIPVIELEDETPTRLTNMLDLTRQIVDAGIKFANSEESEIRDSSNPLLQFFLDNILNDLFIASADVNQVFLDDNSKKFE